MRPFDPRPLRPMPRIPRRLLAASILIATVAVLFMRLIAPEWGHALPALMINGTTLPL